MPLAKVLIEMHGGTLDIASVRAVGTTVTLTLPRSRVLPEETGKAPVRVAG